MKNNNQHVFFSIGIPAFKLAFLKECIDSVLGQYYVNFELIIVNDNSPDSIDELVNSYDDSRIRYYKNEVNFGAENVVENWNKCLSIAKGDYFILLGDDDVLEKNYLYEFHKLILEYPNLNVFHCQSYIINEFSIKIDITSSLPSYETTIENIWHRVNLVRLQYVSDFVYKREEFIRDGGFFKLPLAWGSDDLSSYIAMKDKGIAHVNLPLLCYRKSSLTISSTSDNAKLKIKAINRLHDWLVVYLEETTLVGKDKVLMDSIVSMLPSYTQKKKIHAMTNSFSSGMFKYLTFWFFNRKTFKISIFDIVYAFLVFLKNNHLLLNK
ncbi:glycosyltransferase [Flavicella sp.]|uniref:glycosyltransferase family 2 protein n=1 Tax=Flavicella sp. TaxID=2957742 RepID=UPI003019100E